MIVISDNLSFTIPIHKEFGQVVGGAFVTETSMLFSMSPEIINISPMA